MRFTAWVLVAVALLSASCGVMGPPVPYVDLHPEPTTETEQNQADMNQPADGRQK